jgi:hypothetical protein
MSTVAHFQRLAESSRKPNFPFSVRRYEPAFHQRSEWSERNRRLGTGGVDFTSVFVALKGETFSTLKAAQAPA